MRNFIQRVCCLALLSVRLNDSFGFVSPVSRQRKASALSLVLTDIPQPTSSTIIAPASFDQHVSITTSSINDGLRSFVAQDPTNTIMSSTSVLSLKDRPPPPTAEEIAAKKRNFNLW